MYTHCRCLNNRSGRSYSVRFSPVGAVSISIRPVCLPGRTPFSWGQGGMLAAPVIHGLGDVFWGHMAAVERCQTKHGMFTATDKTCLDGKASCTESSILHEVVSAKVFEFGQLQDLSTMRQCHEIKSRAMKSWPATSPLHFDIRVPLGLSSVGRCAN